MEAHVEPRRAATSRGPVEYAEMGEGPPVIALHGAMGGWDQSLLLPRTIAGPGFRLIGLSRPGYLGTPLSLGRSPEEQADLCAGVLDALGIRAATVMAVSGGGPCGIQFALRHKDRCKALVLVSTVSGKVDTKLPLAFHVLKVAARFRWLANAMEKKAAKQDPDEAASRSIPDAAMRARTLADPAVGPLFRELLASTSSRMAGRLPGTLNDVAVTRERDYPLEQIAVPVLVVHGTEDRMVPFARHGEVLAARIPGAELVACHGGDHVSIYTHNAEVKARVAAFLAAHAS